MAVGRLRSILVGYLVVCFALGGAIGVSPLLHQWIEHGGQGAAHVHLRGAVPNGGRDHPHSHAHGQRGHAHGGDTHKVRQDRTSLFAHSSEPFVLPFRSIIRCVLALLTLPGSSVPPPDRPDSGEPEGVPGHSHDSLPQSLAAGILESHLVQVDAPRPAERRHPEVLRASSFFPASEFDPLTASRAPPLGILRNTAA